MIHLVGVLPRATRTIRVGPVLQDLHSAALSIGLISALLLWGEKHVDDVQSKYSAQEKGFRGLRTGKVFGLEAGSFCVVSGHPSLLNLYCGSKTPSFLMEVKRVLDFLFKVQVLKGINRLF